MVRLPDNSEPPPPLPHTVHMTAGLLYSTGNFCSQTSKVNVISELDCISYIRNNQGPKYKGDLPTPISRA